MDAADKAQLVEDLRAHFDVPADTLCVFLSGSVATGWAHATSDVDVYVVTERLPAVQETKRVRASLTPPYLPAVIKRVSGRTWDVEYLSSGQVDELCAMAAAPDQQARGQERSDADSDLIYRLWRGVDLDPSGTWLVGVQQRLDREGVGRGFADDALRRGLDRLDDAAGLLESGDSASAVLSAHLAFGHVVDACLAAAGELSPKAKWRARKVRLVGLPGMTWDEYWAIETMHGLARVGANAWARDVLMSCERLAENLCG